MTVAITRPGTACRARRRLRSAPAVVAEEIREEAAHRRPPAFDRAGREERVDQPAQAPVVVAVDVEDVAADLLPQRAVVDPEDLGDLHPGERERAWLRRKNSPASRSSATNPSGIDASQLCAPARASCRWNRGPRARVEVVEGGELELADGGHRGRAYRGLTNVNTGWVGSGSDRPGGPSVVSTRRGGSDDALRGRRAAGPDLPQPPLPFAGPLTKLCRDYIRRARNGGGA